MRCTYRNISPDDMRKGKESKIIAEDACRGWTWFGSRTLRQPWFWDAADDSGDERLTYVTYQEVRSILASLVVYVRKAIIKVYPYRGDARQFSEPDFNNRKDGLLTYIGRYAN